MTPERYRQIRQVFEAAAERAPNARAAFLAEACQGDTDLGREVAQLLHARTETTWWLDANQRGPGGRLEGRRIGSYDILRSLGEGGMGSVYLAARADGAFRKLVALKVVRPESATAEVLRRFRQEREILATLDHPNIARILDGGETPEGLPYLVMEYIDGKPIDVYCDEHQLAIRHRLALFEGVCSAVRYAHAKQVIHRDLKPSNVLVTAEGEVKLLDFGIAKLLSGGDGTTLLRTRSELRLMTPEYASPEQVRGETATTLSDIYSLGVLLYELLTGHRPYRLPSRIFSEILRVVCEEPPTRPTIVVMKRPSSPIDQDLDPDEVSRKRGVSAKQLRSELAGDLEGILLKALEKSPQQRYRSVAELAENLQHHLNGEPVQYRKRHGPVAFLQKHPSWVVVILAVALIGWSGLIPFVWLVLGVVTVAGGVLGFWLVQKEYGASYIPRSFVELTFKNMAIVALLMLAAYSLVHKFSDFDIPTTLFALNSLICIWALVVLLRWPMRASLLGPVLLDVSRKPNRALAAIMLVASAMQVIVGILSYRESLPHPSSPFVYFHLANLPPGAIESGYRGTSFPITAYALLSEQPSLFTNVIAFAPLSKLSQVDTPYIEQVSANLFSALGIPAFLGRLLRNGDETMSAHVVVLSHHWWTQKYASDPAVIGRSVFILGIPFTVIGVAPPPFTGIDPHHATDLWIPLQTSRQLSPWGEPPKPELTLYGSPEWYCLSLVGEVVSGNKIPEALAKLPSRFQRSASSGQFVRFDPALAHLSFAPATLVQPWNQSNQDPKRNSWRRAQALQGLSACLFALYFIFVIPHAELRAKGITSAGVFIRWRSLDGYSWQTQIGEYQLLRFRMRGILKWWPIPFCLLVKKDFRAQVENILNRYFAEWPV